MISFPQKPKENARNLSNVGIFVVQKKVPVACCFIDLSSVFTTCLLSCVLQHVGLRGLHLQWQCGGSGGLHVFARGAAAVFWDWWAETTFPKLGSVVQGVRVSRVYTQPELFMCPGSVWPTVKATTKFHWQQHKRFGDRWALAGPELMFLFFGVLVLYQLLCRLLPENITVLALDGLKCQLTAKTDLGSFSNLSIYFCTYIFTLCYINNIIHFTTKHLFDCFYTVTKFW